MRSHAFVKAGMRRAALERRAALAPDERARLSAAVCMRLTALPVLAGPRTLAGYRALRSEADPAAFLAGADRRGAVVALPRVERERLVLHRWRPGEPLERGPFGLEEPRRLAPVVDPGSLEAILVPGIAFDRRGHRLGYGRGYYDRLLPTLAKAVRVGVAFDAQVVEELPAEPHDARLDWLVTETQVLDFHSVH